MDPLDCADLMGEFEGVVQEGGCKNSNGVVALIALPALSVQHKSTRGDSVCVCYTCTYLLKAETLTLMEMEMLTETGMLMALMFQKRGSLTQSIAL